MPSVTCMTLSGGCNSEKWIGKNMEGNDGGRLGERMLKCAGCTKENRARSVRVASVRFHIWTRDLLTLQSTECVIRSFRCNIRTKCISYSRIWDVTVWAEWIAGSKVCDYHQYRVGSVQQAGRVTVSTERVVCSKMWDVAVGTEGGGRYSQCRVGGVQQAGVVTCSTEWVVCSKMWDVAVGTEGGGRYRRYGVGGVQQDVGCCSR